MTAVSQPSRRAGVLGLGRYLPARVVTNAEIAERAPTTAAWIYEKIGVEQRRVASSLETQEEMGVAAAIEALADARVEPAAVDLIVVTTNVPDQLIPPTAARIQSRLRATRASAFDIPSGCPAFLHAVQLADAFIVSQRARYVLVVAAERLSSLVDWEARGFSCILGDAAAAMLLGPVEGGQGVLGTYARTRGDESQVIHMPAGGCAEPSSVESVVARRHFLQMDGRRVKELVLAHFEDAIDGGLRSAGLQLDQIDLIVPHQANRRLLEEAADRLGITRERLMINIQTWGNTSSASVPLALYDAREAARLKSGTVTLSPVFGAGFSYGSIVMRWV
jgi:3-oxoacyl-[acyl-carrier-protein] synthase-3